MILKKMITKLFLEFEYFPEFLKYSKIQYFLEFEKYSYISKNVLDFRIMFMKLKREKEIEDKIKGKW